uniref:Ovule protein n=1 Tax=Parascaris univalens TaxID=6257 RepID=A0A915BXJ1_PARUN
MLANGRALVELCSDPAYDCRTAGPLFILLEDRWRSAYGILKANLLFIFNRVEDVGVEAPFILLILEDCYMELCDDNTTGRTYSFQIKFKTTGRNFTMAAENFKALEKWISMFTVSSIDYIRLTKQSFQDQMTDTASKRSTQSTHDQSA